MRDRRPHAAHLGPKGGRTSGVPLDRLEEQPRQRSRAHGCTTTTKLTGEPSTGVPTARVAVASTTTWSGGVPGRIRTCTAASPALVAPVAGVASAEGVGGVARGGRPVAAG